MVGALADEITGPSAGEFNLALSDDNLELEGGVTGEKIQEWSIEIISMEAMFNVGSWAHGLEAGDGQNISDRRSLKIANELENAEVGLSLVGDCASLYVHQTYLSS